MLEKKLQNVIENKQKINMSVTSFPLQAARRGVHHVLRHSAGPDPPGCVRGLSGAAGGGDCRGSEPLAEPELQGDFLLIK